FIDVDTDRALVGLGDGRLGCGDDGHLNGLRGVGVVLGRAARPTEISVGVENFSTASAVHSHHTTYVFARTSGLVVRQCAVCLGVEEGVEIRRSRRRDLAEPAGAVGVGIDQFGRPRQGVIYRADTAR